jgi:hypothetical protein
MDRTSVTTSKLLKLNVFDGWIATNSCHQRQNLGEKTMVRRAPARHAAQQWDLFGIAVVAYRSMTVAAR